MRLSDEQMSAVTGGQVGEWSEVDRPVGPQPLPDWVRGAHVDWMNGCGNAPNVTVKARGALHHWEDQRFEKVGKEMYIARHPDGRAVAHYHRGAVSLVTIKDKRNHHVQDVLAGRRKELPDVEVMATSQQSGYGGDNFWIKMLDGSDLVLRGPWHGGTPDGYVEVSVVDVTSKYFQADRWNRNRPWFKRGGGPSVYLTEELFLRIVARYCAHAPVARVDHSYGTRLEMFRAEWGMPKAFIYDQERMRAQKKDPAGTFWRVYWDGSELYCGSLRMPTNGFMEGVQP